MQFPKCVERGKIINKRLIGQLILLCTIFGFSTFHLIALADDSGTGPHPGLKPLDEHGTMQISKEDRCPMCAMQVSKYPNFVCAIQLIDGRTFYFCSAGCMIRSWIQPEIFLGVEREKLRRSVVQDYFTGEQVSGGLVFWVAGSDVIGPMGPALVPLKSVAHLETFKRRHGAKTVFRLSELTDANWKQLTGK
ncbi:MAG: nitrous oxide reductase accessory protein NosL [Desulfobacterales bacterium]|jgi:nitrous oxide reductase accessory protein NosL